MSCVGGCLRSEKCPSIVGQWTTLAIDERRRARRARVQSFVQSSAAAAALQSARRGAGVAGHALDWSVFHWCRRSSTSDASKSSSSLAAITWFNPSPTQPTSPSAARSPISRGNGRARNIRCLCRQYQCVSRWRGDGQQQSVSERCVRRITGTHRHSTSSSSTGADCTTKMSSAAVS